MGSVVSSPVSSRFQALKPTLLRGSGFKPGFKPVLKTQTPKQRDLAARPARGKRGAPSLRKRLPTSGHKASVSPARFQAGFRPVSGRFQAGFKPPTLKRGARPFFSAAMGPNQRKKSLLGVRDGKRRFQASVSSLETTRCGFKPLKPLVSSPGFKPVSSRFQAGFKPVSRRTKKTAGFKPLKRFVPIYIYIYIYIYICIIHTQFKLPCNNT